jgi:hypothetical protein
MSAKIGVQAEYKYISSLVTFDEIPLPRGKTKAEILSTGSSEDNTYVSYQLGLIDEVLNSTRAVAQAPVKKK